jgi:hypothetical protein
MAQGSGPVVQGRPAAVPPMERLAATKAAVGGAGDPMNRKPSKV